MRHPDEKDVEDLKEKTPEELALFLMRLATQQQSLGMFHPKEMKDDQGVLTGVPLHPPAPEPDPPQANAVTLEVSEAWNWAMLNGMVMEAPGDNGQNGWKVLTKKGVEAVERFRREAEQPKGKAEPLGERVAPPTGTGRKTEIKR